MKGFERRIERNIPFSNREYREQQHSYHIWYIPISVLGLGVRFWRRHHNRCLYIPVNLAFPSVHGVLWNLNVIDNYPISTERTTALLYRAYGHTILLFEGHVQVSFVNRVECKKVQNIY